MNTKGHYRYIDALRGLAILGVIMVHTSQYGSQLSPGLFLNIVQNGARGVQLFFVLSAYTLFLSMSRRTKDPEEQASFFYIRRFFRIAPSYYLFIIYFVILQLLTGREGFSAGLIGSNVLFIHGINPYWINDLVPGGWSISVEMLFYLMVPFLFKLINTLDKAVIFTTMSVFFMVGVNTLLRFILTGDDYSLNDFLFLYLPSQLPLFGLGFIAFFIIEKRDLTINSLSLLLLSLVLICQVFFKIIPSHILFGISFLLLTIALSMTEWKFLVNRFSVFLGKISYSAYLIHFAVLFWLNYLSIFDILENLVSDFEVFKYIARVLVVVICTTVLSHFFGKIVEKKGIELGKSFIKQLRVVNAKANDKAQ